MNRGTVALVAPLPIDHAIFDLLGEQFRWTIETASLERVTELSAHHNLVAVLFSPSHLALPWEQALEAVLKAAPQALPIICNTFTDRLDWPRAAEAGAFHSLLLPFDAREVRQSLGFAWSAQRRSETVLKPRARRLRRIMRQRTRLVKLQLLSPPA